MNKKEDKYSNITFNKDVLSAMAFIQHDAGDYYYRLIDCIQGLILEDGDLFDGDSHQQIDAVRGLHMLKNDIARLAGIAENLRLPDAGEFETDEEEMAAILEDVAVIKEEERKIG